METIWSNKLENFIKKHITQKYAHYFNFSIYELEHEKHILTQKIEKREELMHKYRIVKYYTEIHDQASILDDEELVNENISNKIIDDIEWLRSWINHYTNRYWNTKTPNRNDIEKYENILVKLKKLIDMYSDLEEDNLDTIPDVVKNIQNVLDFFFFSQGNLTSESEIAKNSDIAFNALNHLETLAYTIFNRIDEYRFEIDNLEYDFDNDFNVAIELIDMLLQKYTA